MQTRCTGKRDGDGILTTKSVTKKANIGIEAQHLQNTFLREQLALERGAAAESEAVTETKRAKAEVFDAACKTNSQLLAQFIQGRRRQRDLVACLSGCGSA